MRADTGVQGSPACSRMQASLHPVPEHPLIPSQAFLHPLAIIPTSPSRASLLWAWERAASSWLVFIPNSRDLPSRQARGYLRLLSCSSDPHVSLKQNKNILQNKITTACNFLQKKPSARLKSWLFPEVLSCMALGAESWRDARGALGATPVLLCPPWGLRHSRHPHVPAVVVYPAQIVIWGTGAAWDRRKVAGDVGGSCPCRRICQAPDPSPTARCRAVGPRGPQTGATGNGEDSQCRD